MGNAKRTGKQQGIDPEVTRANTKIKGSDRTLEANNMKKTFDINGRKVEFTECTAISSDYPEGGRRSCIMIHDVADEFCDGDGVIFDCD